MDDLQRDINILYDWLSFSDHQEGINVNSALLLLGIDGSLFSMRDHGNRGYRSAIFFDGITINFDHPLHSGFWIEMSGSGCRTFETYSEHGSFDVLFEYILKYNCNLNRLDIALDEFIGILNMDVMCLDVRLKNYISPMRSWTVTESDKGQNIDIGSNQSDIKIRIYDKAAERKKEGHWIRVELQLREERALGFILNKNDLKEKVPGILLNYLRFVVPEEGDTNKSRWSTRPYWDNFLQTAQRIGILIKGGKEYNISNTENYVYKFAGNCVYTLIACYGIDRFFSELCLNKPKMAKKYLDIIEEFENGKMGVDTID